MGQWREQRCLHFPVRGLGAHHQMAQTLQGWGLDPGPTSISGQGPGVGVRNPDRPAPPPGSRAQGAVPLARTGENTQASTLACVRTRTLTPDPPSVPPLPSRRPTGLAQAFSHILAEERGQSLVARHHLMGDGARVASSSETHPPCWGRARPAGSRPGPAAVFHTPTEPHAPGPGRS